MTKYEEEYYQNIRKITNIIEKNLNKEKVKVKVFYAADYDWEKEMTEFLSDKIYVDCKMLGDKTIYLFYKE